MPTADTPRRRLLPAPERVPALQLEEAGIVSNVVDEAFLGWLDVGDPARDEEMVVRVVYLLGGIGGSVLARAKR